MFRQVCIIEPSFFKTLSGMHRRPIECRHLVHYLKLYEKVFHASVTLIEVLLIEASCQKKYDH